jgi:hypothetical protein
MFRAGSGVLARFVTDSSGSVLLVARARNGNVVFTVALVEGIKGDPANCCNQALGQACALHPSFCGTMSVTAILR